MSTPRPARPRVALPTITGALLAALAALAVLALAGRLAGNWAGPAVPAPRPDDRGRHLLPATTVPLPGGIALAVGSGALWVAGKDEDGRGFALHLHTAPNTGLDAGAGRASARIPLRVPATDVATGPSGAWVAQGPRHEVVRIDPATDRVTGTFQVTGPEGTPLRPTHLAVDGRGTVWAGCAEGWLVAIHGRTGRRLRLVPLPQGARSGRLTVDGDALWVALGQHGVLRLSTASGRSTPRTIPLKGMSVAQVQPADARGTALAAGNLTSGIVQTGSGALARVDPRAPWRATVAGTGGGEARVLRAGLPDRPRWWLIEGGGTLRAVDPATGRVAGKPVAHVDGGVRAVADGERLWVLDTERLLLLPAP